jgi:superoxide dismutase, Cu-Zn family
MKYAIAVLSILSCAFLGACGPEKVNEAVVRIVPTNGNTVSGFVRFKTEKTGVRVIAELKGLTPGKHGFHIHQKGDCTAADGTSAGGHFNPTKYPHGGPNDKHRHVGDLGNITADNSGLGLIDHVDHTIKLNGANSIIGRSIVVHANHDDLNSQPSGFAGPRQACGVIGIAK